jgi:hypothetical protein
VSRVNAGAASPPASAPLNTVPLDRETFSESGAPETATPEPREPTKAEYDAWVSTRVVEMVLLGFDGDDIVGWLDIVKPEIVKDLDKYTDAQIESLFSLDPILARALSHPNWKNVLAQAKRAAAEIVAEEAEEPELVSEKIN